MKKLLISVLTVFLLTSIPLNALAAYSSDIDVSYSFSDNGNVIVYASIVNIQDPYGIASIEYSIEYDNSALELQSVEVGIPDEWQDENIMENWSFQQTESIYYWSLLNHGGQLGELYGIKEDNVLYITLEFKTIVQKNIEIEFNALSASNINVEEVQCASKTITIDYSSIDVNDTSDYSQEEIPNTDNSITSEPQIESQPIDTTSSSEASKESINDSSIVVDNESSTSVDSTISNDFSNGTNIIDNSGVSEIAIAIVFAVVIVLGILLFYLLKSRKEKSK